MSELKAYRFLGQDEVWPDANFGSDYYLKCSDYYLKSEADKRANMGVVGFNVYKCWECLCGIVEGA